MRQALNAKSVRCAQNINFSCVKRTWALCRKPRATGRKRLKIDAQTSSWAVGEANVLRERLGCADGVFQDDVGSPEVAEAGQLGAQDGQLDAQDGRFGGQDAFRRRPGCDSRASKSLQDAPGHSGTDFLTILA